MPFFVPILFGLSAVGLALFGLDRGQRGRRDADEARALLAEAETAHARAITRLERERARVNDRATAFAHQKEALLRGPLAEVTAFLEAIQERGALNDIRTLASVRLLLPEPPAGQQLPLTARDALNWAGMMTFTGAAAAQSAILSAALFGVASTGAAIGGLSGAAATSATLAWLGGGALTAGGGGMVLGRVVLGGVALGPVFALLGLLVEKQGSRSLTAALEVQAEARERVAQIETVIALLRAVQTRMDELSALLDGLAARLSAVLRTLDAQRWSADSEADLVAFQTMMSLAMALGAVIRAPVLDAAGSLAPESYQVQVDYRDLVAGEVPRGQS